MIAAKVTKPGSDIWLGKSFRTVYYPWDSPAIGKDDLCRSLDALIGFKDRFEMHLFMALKPDTSLIHYDHMLSYFEDPKNVNNMVCMKDTLLRFLKVNILDPLDGTARQAISKRTVNFQTYAG